MDRIQPQERPADKNEEQLELLKLTEGSIRVASDLTERPSRELIERKLLESIEHVRVRAAPVESLPRSILFELELVPYPLDRDEPVDCISRLLERTSSESLAVLVKPLTRFFIGDLDVPQTRPHRNANIVFPTFGELLANRVGLLK